MSTQSTTSYEWSLKGVIGKRFTIGIASKSIRDLPLHEYDENSIVYVSDPFAPNKSIIRHGSNTIHSGLKELLGGDVISFCFQPDTKKLIIDRVRNTKFSSINS